MKAPAEALPGIGTSGDPRVARVTSLALMAHRVRRIAWLAGWDLRPGLPRRGEHVAAWGPDGRSARRAAALSRRMGAPVLWLGDAWLRSLHPRAAGEPPLGLLIDARAAHDDAGRPSTLETLLATHPFDDGDLLARTRRAVNEWRASGIGRYAAARADLDPPEPGYVLVVDQPADDPGIGRAGASATTFREMLMLAREENPGARILVKTHPEARLGSGRGHFTEADATHGAAFEDRPLPSGALLAGATRVYAVSSQMGLEAILHGHVPETFGRPAWSGWGLDAPRDPLARRQRTLTRMQLMAAVLVLYPSWYDPHRDQLCDPVDVLRLLEARARAWREDRPGWRASGLRLSERPPLARFLSGRVSFRAGRAPDDARRLVRAGAADAPAAEPATRFADGFLRSRGSAAERVPPMSLLLDRTGLHFDPARPSDLEAAILRAAALPPEALDRARALRRAIVSQGLSKYNLGRGVPALPHGHVVLVVGQAADAASLRLGGARIRDNAALLREARAANPDAVLVYKPHPDVEAGLRPGAIDAAEADFVAREADPVALIERADAVWTMTSLMGFEALLRGTPVTTLGTPFYAGWGLTTDLGPVPVRRSAARPSLEALVHAALIDAPRYHDPVLNAACPPETVLHRLSHGPDAGPGAGGRALDALRGALATYARPWPRAGGRASSGP